MQAQTQYTTRALDLFSVSTETKLIRPLVDQGISAGFPSPAQDFMDLSIDLNKELIQHPDATFFGRVKGNSMMDAGICNCDLLIVDKSQNPTDGKIAVCFIDGEFTVKRLKLEKDCSYIKECKFSISRDQLKYQYHLKLNSLPWHKNQIAKLLLSIFVIENIVVSVYLY